MPTYSEAPGSVQALIDDLIADFYPDMVEAHAKVGAVMAHPTYSENTGEPTGPAVTEYGMEVESKVKVNSESDRIEGKPDATITLDARVWNRWTEDEDAETGKGLKEALIDRMLHGLEVRRKDGAIVVDDNGRPKLKKRKPDYAIAGFRAIAERHGARSSEVRHARQLHDAYGNILFSFGDEYAQESLPGVEPGPKPKRRRGAAVVAAANR